MAPTHPAIVKPILYSPISSLRKPATNKRYTLKLAFQMHFLKVYIFLASFHVSFVFFQVFLSYLQLSQGLGNSFKRGCGNGNSLKK